MRISLAIDWYIGTRETIGPALLGPRIHSDIATTGHNVFVLWLTIRIFEVSSKVCAMYFINSSATEIARVVIGHVPRFRCFV